MGLADMSISELGELYGRREVKPSAVVEACLDRIDRRNGRVKAFLHIFHDEAMKRAAGPSTAYRLPSKIISARAACQRPARRACSKATVRHTTPRSSGA